MRDVWRDVWRDVRKREALADVINLALGAWLFLTPWIFGFTSEAATSWNAWLSGLAIGAIAIAALVAFTEWEEWINLVLGIWVAISAWVVGFTSHATMAWVSTIVGILVAIIAAVRIWMLHHNPPRVTA
jgi:hypothetical protein